MHDCRTMESRLVDLVFDELDARETSRLTAELESCSNCLSEYRSMTGTLGVFDNAVEASQPGEAFWLAQRATLINRLEESAPRATPRRAESFWKRLLTARLPVPVPVAALILVGLMVSSVLALRPRASAPMTATPIAINAPPEVIEVPVFQERVVTRTVYVIRKVREKAEPSRQAPATEPSAAALASNQSEAESVKGSFFTHANLTDFQPLNELTIRVIKRSNSNED